MKRINTFVDINSKVVKGSKTRTEESSKRAGDKLESDKSKKQKIDEHVEAEKDNDPEEEEMKKHIEIVQDKEEIAIDVIPLATKPPMIVQYKIGIDREFLETLWKLVKENHGINRLVDEYERVLWALEQESSKKQKVDDDKETEELKQCMEIISDDGDDVTIEATPLSTKSLTIVDYKIYKEEKKFKARFKKTWTVNYMDTFLHLNLKTMFKHHLEDNVWKNQQGLVKVHCVTMQNILYYMLVEKMYPLTKHTLHQMFNDVKLQVDSECEMAFKLLRLVKKQLKEGHVPQ
ncbi:hypothetical protein Tco_1038787 [Tanacetum coccineum]